MIISIDIFDDVHQFMGLTLSASHNRGIIYNTFVIVGASILIEVNVFSIIMFYRTYSFVSIYVQIEIGVWNRP